MRTNVFVSLVLCAAAIAGVGAESVDDSTRVIDDDSTTSYSIEPSFNPPVEGSPFEANTFNPPGPKCKKPEV